MSVATTGELVTSALIHGAVYATPGLLVGLAVSRFRGLSAAGRHAAWTVTLLSLPAWPLLAATLGAPHVSMDLAAVWVIGLTGTLLPMLLGLFRLQRLTATAHPHPLRPDAEVVDAEVGPLTFGWLRPRILLPRTSRDWPHTVLLAALAHERAHVARRDWAVHAAVWVACSALWFHPLVWLARREHGRLMELAADDLALASGLRPSAYARALMSLAALPAPGALSAGSAHLKQRVLAALRPEQRSNTRWPFALAALLLTLASMAAAPSAATTGPSASPTCNPGDPP